MLCVCEITVPFYPWLLHLSFESVPLLDQRCPFVSCQQLFDLRVTGLGLLAYLIHYVLTFYCMVLSFIVALASFKSFALVSPNLVVQGLKISKEKQTIFFVSVYIISSILINDQ